MPSPLWWTSYTAWAAAVVGVALRVNRLVDEPYMDEIFHVPQAHQYCQGNWRYWDGALTTPPGLYLLPAFLAHAQRFLNDTLPAFLRPRWGQVDPCSLPSLRATNLILVLLLPFLYLSLLSILHPSSTPSPPSSPRKKPFFLAFTHIPTIPFAAAGAEWTTLVLALNPLVGWWAWLYYTDIFSLVAVLLAWQYSLRKRYLLSALVGVASLWFRQTNLIWLLFIAGQAAVSQLKVAAPSSVHDPLLASCSSPGLIQTPLSLLTALFRHPLALLPVLGAYLPVFCAAGAFVRWNGGIVLGDKQNHVATIHVPQLYYFLAFVGVFFAPSILSPRKVGRALTGLGASPRRILTSATMLVALCWTIKRFTIAHPFLLADNRHYTFYLWRRVINVHPLARYALAPGYILAGRLIFDELARAHSTTLSTLLLFVGATSAVLVPTSLLEPRYFIIPLVLLRLYLFPSPSHPLATSSSSSRYRTRLALEALLYVAVQAVCVYLFLEKPFLWDVQVGAEGGKGLEGRDEREVGRLQRFLW
ncbi:hypothetical protein JCM8547_001212 [Rhodosporidiobolus lusitaniae]